MFHVLVGGLIDNPWEPSKLSQVPMDSVIDISKMPGMVGKKLLGRMLWMAAVWWDRKLIWRWDINFFWWGCHSTSHISHSKSTQNHEKLRIFKRLQPLPRWIPILSVFTASDASGMVMWRCSTTTAPLLVQVFGRDPRRQFRIFAWDCTWDLTWILTFSGHWTFWQLQINVGYPLVN
jgi:hypothetical protein